MNRETMIQQTAAHAEKVRHALESGRRPETDDCMALIDALSDLHTCISEDSTPAPAAAADTGVEPLFEAFSAHMDDTAHYLRELDACLSAGKVPPQEQVSAFDDAVNLLRQNYEALRRAAERLLPEEELPEAQAAAIEYVNAVRNSRTLQRRKQLDDAAQCLEKFVSIRSQVERYTSALADYQSRAAALLRALRSGAEPDAQALKDGTDGPGAILAAIECENKDAEQGLALCDRVADYYPGHVYTGVVANKYYIDAEILKEVQTQAEKAPGPEQPDESEADGAQQEPETAAFVDLLRKSGAFLRSDAEIGEAALEISQNEEKKITASIFQNEMRQGAVPEERCILQEIESRLWVTQKTLAGWGVPPKNAEQGLAYLYKKGYLRKFGLQGGRGVYLASPRLVKALQYQDACKFANVRQKTFQNWTFEVNRTAAEAAALACCSELYAAARERLTEAGAKKLKGGGCTAPDTFCCDLYDAADAEACEVFLGAFWTEESGCGELLHAVQQMQARHGKIRTLTVAALHEAQANALARALLRAAGGSLPSTRLLLYAFAEQTFAPYTAEQ